MGHKGDGRGIRREAGESTYYSHKLGVEERKSRKDNGPTDVPYTGLRGMMTWGGIANRGKRQILEERIICEITRYRKKWARENKEEPYQNRTAAD